MDTIRNNARFTEMTRAWQKYPEKYANRLLGYISKLSPVMAEAVRRYGQAILRNLYDDVQVFRPTVWTIFVLTLFFQSTQQGTTLIPSTNTSSSKIHEIKR